MADNKELLETIMKSKSNKVYLKPKDADSFKSYLKDNGISDKVHAWVWHGRWEGFRYEA